MKVDAMKKVDPLISSSIAEEPSVTDPYPRWIAENDFEKACFTKIYEEALSRRSEIFRAEHNGVVIPVNREEPGDSDFFGRLGTCPEWDDEGFGRVYLSIEPKRFNFWTHLENPAYPVYLWIEEDGSGQPVVAWSLEACPYILEQKQTNYFPFMPVLTSPN